MLKFESKTYNTKCFESLTEGDIFIWTDNVNNFLGMKILDFETNHPKVLDLENGTYFEWDSNEYEVVRVFEEVKLVEL